ncbi:MAG: tetratricopeptide repeat protein, partial [Chloroflexota bacterium]
AESIHRLIYDLANGGAALLLTSRNQPADLPNELLYPEGSHALRGLGDEAGVDLFFQHSAKAKENAEAHLQFAFDIQRAAEGHPLAIALLAGEYDVSAVTMDAFLQGWQGELTNARRSGLAGHHITFTTAFERSYSHLAPDLKLALTCLSIFTFPFFAQGFAVVTGELPTADDEPQTVDNTASSMVNRLSSAKQTLDELTRRSLLEVEGTYEDGTPATYRFQPALRQEAAHRLDSALEESQQKGYAAYGAWLANRGYGNIYSDLGLNRVVRLSMDAMEKATDTLQGAERLWHIRTLAWLKNAWGETRAAFDLLSAAISQTLPDAQTDPESAEVESSLRFELAGIYEMRGDLDRALSLYEESLQLIEQLGDKQGKAASLHAIAKVFLTRGDLDRALSLYEESLTLHEQFGDKQGKATSLSQMAEVFLTRGDLDHALSLYEESLALKEQLGDKKGKSTSLYQMAEVFLGRGDLDRALSLYEESLALDEQLGDKKGKAASLHAIAQVFLTRGDLDHALSLYEESLAFIGQLGDKKGKAASLSQMANVYWEKKEFSQAQHLVEQSIEISYQIGDLQAVAYNVLKLGQLSQVLGDKTTALARFQESLALFERLGAQPMIANARQKIANLEGGAVANDDPLAQVIAQARASAERGDLPSAIQYQEQAVALVREASQEREALVRLSVLLFNLAGFYAKANRYDDAVKSMQEVVAIDEQTGHQDLESDREMLKKFEQIASMSPEERAQLQNSQASTPASGAGEQGDFESQLQAQLAQLPPEERPQAEAQIRKAYEDFQRMSPEEQAAVVAGQRRAQIDNAAEQVRDAGLAYFRKQAPKRDVLNMLEGASKNMKDGESAGSPWLEVAALCDAIIALVKEEPVPPVPAAYASHFSAVQSEIGKLKT